MKKFFRPADLDAPDLTFYLLTGNKKVSAELYKNRADAIERLHQRIRIYTKIGKEHHVEIYLARLHPLGEVNVDEGLTPSNRITRRNLVKMEIEAAKRNGLDSKRNRKAVAV